MLRTRKTNTIQKQGVSKLQCKKTTEYCREPKQKQAKSAQLVIEITVYQGQVKTARTKPNDQYIVH